MTRRGFAEIKLPLTALCTHLSAHAQVQTPPPQGNLLAPIYSLAEGFERSDKANFHSSYPMPRTPTASIVLGRYRTQGWIYFCARGYVES